MEDRACVEFLQWAAPRLQMRWQGFRRVRKQVCKRIQRRITTLQLEGVNAYRDYLGANPLEWKILDKLLRVVVTRFYRDRKVFDDLYHKLLPERLGEIRSRGGSGLRVWSIGCASGEEPYTLSLLWHHLPTSLRQGLALDILATDSDAYLLQRAETACYPYGAIKALPDKWPEMDFEKRAGDYCLHERHKKRIRFELHDVRQTFEYGNFDLLFCRNLVFTYFNEPLQMQTLDKLYHALSKGGMLIIGAREALPAGQGRFEQLRGYRGIYLRRP